MKYWRFAMFILPLLASCTATISEKSLLAPVRGGALTVEALRQAAQVYRLSEHTITAADGTRLYAVLLRQSGARATLLYFGGNGYTIGRFGAWTARQFAPLGVDIMIVDHRGYGQSGGSPSQAALEADGLAAFDHIVEMGGVPANRIVVHGQSLGSFIAGHVAANRKSGGVVLESSATTAEEWIDSNRRGLMRALVRVELDPALRGRGNLANMPRIEEPLLILVGAIDRTTPPRLSQALYAASPLPLEQRMLGIIPRAGHNDVMMQPETARIYSAFLERLSG